MLLETRSHVCRTAGWSKPLPSELDSDRTVVIAFAAHTFGAGSSVLDDLRQAFPRSSVLGCSTAGEIHHDRVHDASVSVAIVRFEKVTPRIASVPIGEGAASFAAGEELARRLTAPDLRAMIVLCDGLVVNGSELARSISSVLPPSVVVTGGLAGDGPRFQETWVWDGAERTPGRVVGLGLFGASLAVTHGSKGGWDIFGPERRVTRSEGNVLYELDDKPALKLYKDYLGERASGLPATALLFPLAIRSEAGQRKQLVRTVLATNEQDQSLTFAGNIPTGSLAQLMRANVDRLVEGAADAASLARDPNGGDSPTLSVAISCVGRRLVLGGRTDEELEATLDALPPPTRQIGFYSYGELAPFETGSCDLHNQTMTLTTLAERP